MKRKDRYTDFDIHFKKEQIGCLITYNEKHGYCSICGFYQEFTSLLEAELSDQLMPGDEIIRINRMDVFGFSMEEVTKLISTSTRPFCITFRRYTADDITPISFDSILFNEENRMVLRNYLQKISFILPLNNLCFIESIHSFRHLSTPMSDYIQLLEFQFINPDSPKYIGVPLYEGIDSFKTEKEQIDYYLSWSYNYLYTKCWPSFIQSIDYKELCLPFSSILNSQFKLNYFLMYLVYIDDYKQLYLYIQIQYELLTLYKIIDSQQKKESTPSLSMKNAYFSFSSKTSHSSSKYNQHLSSSQDTISLFWILFNRLYVSTFYSTAEKTLTVNNVHLLPDLLLHNLTDYYHTYKQYEYSGTYPGFSTIRSLSFTLRQIIDTLSQVLFKQHYNEFLLSDFFSLLMKAIYYHSHSITNELQGISIIIIINPSTTHNNIGKDELKTIDKTILEKEKRRDIDIDDTTTILHDKNNNQENNHEENDNTISDKNNTISDKNNMKNTKDDFRNTFKITSLNDTNSSSSFSSLSSSYPSIQDINLTELENSMKTIKNSTKKNTNDLFKRKSLNQLLYNYGKEKLDKLKTFVIYWSDNNTKDKKLVDTLVSTSSSSSLPDYTYSSPSLIDILECIAVKYQYSIHYSPYICNTMTSTISPSSSSSIPSTVFGYIYFTTVFKDNRWIIQSENMAIDKEQQSITDHFPSHILDFVYPEGIFPLHEYKSPRVFTFLLGGDTGRRWTCSCLNVFEKKEIQGGSTIYLPTGLCLLSLYPQLENLRYILKEFYKKQYSILPYVENEEKRQILLNMLFQTKHSTGRQRRFSISTPRLVSLNTSRLSSFSLPSIYSLYFPSFNYSFLPPLHVSLSYLFSTFSIRHIIVLYKLLLLERRILFVSKSITTLTYVMDGLKQLIYPYKWFHVYCPLLPTSLSEYIYCPSPYCIGLLESTLTLSMMSHIEGVDIVYIETDTIHIADPVHDLLFQQHSPKSVTDTVIPIREDRYLDKNIDILPPLPSTNQINIYIEIGTIIHPSYLTSDDASIVMPFVERPTVWDDSKHILNYLYLKLF
ncbi:hypothetical protein WA158_002077 [Blastocystis sp. Blastoise]